MPAELSGAALGADELTERADEQQHTEQPPELPDELKKLQADIEKHAAQLIDSTQTEYNNFCHMSSQLDGLIHEEKIKLATSKSKVSQMKKLFQSFTGEMEDSMASPSHGGASAA